MFSLIKLGCISAGSASHPLTATSLSSRTRTSVFGINSIALFESLTSKCNIVELKSFLNSSLSAGLESFRTVHSVSLHYFIPGNDIYFKLLLHGD